MTKLWWIAPLFAVAISAIVLLASYAQRRRDSIRARQYRRLYAQILAKLSHTTTIVNALAELLPFVSNVKVVAYYQDCLRSLENILILLTKLPRFGTDLGPLKSAYILSRSCQKKVERTRSAFRRTVQGRAPNYNKLYDVAEAQRLPKGCYFCSRPYQAEKFSRVRTKINGVAIEVYGCQVCRDELVAARQVNVLYFLKEGQPVHWSQVDGYVPSENYWELNKRAPKSGRPQLELVVAKAPQ